MRHAARLLLAGLPLLALLLATPPRAQAANELPSFVLKGTVFCVDPLDFAAWERTGNFYTRGGDDTCHTIQGTTRAVVMQRDSSDVALVMLADGPDAYAVGWTNAPLPVLPDATAPPAEPVPLPLLTATGAALPKKAAETPKDERPQPP